MNSLAEVLRIGDLAESQGVPLYVRLAASLRTRILQCEWKVGDRLPPFDQLANRYGVALNTVRKAIEVLSSQGMVTSGRGAGTRITADATRLVHPDVRAAINDPMSVSPEHSVNVLVNEDVDAVPVELREDYVFGSRYRHVHKVHSFRGVPYGMIDGFVHRSEYRRFPENAEYRQTLTRLLHDHGAMKVVTSRQELTITHADQQVATRLRYPIAAPLVRLRRWRFGKDGMVIYASIILYRSDLFVWDVTDAQPEADHFNAHIFPNVRRTVRRNSASRENRAEAPTVERGSSRRQATKK